MNNDYVTSQIEMNADFTAATVDGVVYKVTKIHSWDDCGYTQETAMLEGYGEIYSYDEGATWTDWDGGEDW